MIIKECDCLSFSRLSSTVYFELMFNKSNIVEISSIYRCNNNLNKIKII